MYMHIKLFKHDIKLMFLTYFQNIFLKNAYIYSEENSYKNNFSDIRKKLLNLYEMSQIL